MGRRNEGEGQASVVVPSSHTDLDSMQTCPRGHKYWPSQKWIHRECGVDHQIPVVVNEVVVNKEVNEVVNIRSKDRHKKTLERAEYQRLKMREYRSKK